MQLVFHDRLNLSTEKGIQSEIDVLSDKFLFLRKKKFKRQPAA